MSTEIQKNTSISQDIAVTDVETIKSIKMHRHETMIHKTPEWTRTKRIMRRNGLVYELYITETKDWKREKLIVKRNTELKTITTKEDE